MDEGWAVESVGAVLVNPAHHRLVAVPANKLRSYGPFEYVQILLLPVIL